MYSQVENLAYELRLFGFRAEAQRRCEAAIASNTHPADLVRLLLEDEKMQRRQASAKRMVSRAKFRNLCFLEDWDLSFDRGLSNAKFKELAKLNFLQKLENLIILGKTGVGKTHLALAIGNRICQEVHTTLFLSVNLLFEELQGERVAGRYLKAVKKLATAKALILDDFGLRSYTHAEASSLLEILEERYSKGVTIVTSQVQPKGWVSLFEDPVIAEAIIDRLCNPALIVALSGESYRKKRKQS